MSQTSGKLGLAKGLRQFEEENPSPLSRKKSFPGIEDSREENREGNGTPLQYSCLENPMDGGAWWAAVHGVAEGRT